MKQYKCRLQTPKKTIHLTLANQPPNTPITGSHDSHPQITMPRLRPPFRRIGATSPSVHLLSGCGDFPPPPWRNQSWKDETGEKVNENRGVKADSKREKDGNKILPWEVENFYNIFNEGANFGYLRDSFVDGVTSYRWFYSKGQTCQTKELPAALTFLLVVSRLVLDQVTYHAARVWASHSIDASRPKSQHCRSCSSHGGLGWQMLSWSWYWCIAAIPHVIMKKKLHVPSLASSQKQNSFTSHDIPRFWDVPITSHCWEDDEILLTALKLIHGGNP